jgi:hypothetical protein
MNSGNNTHREITEAAQEYFDTGLNVMPLRYGTKEPFGGYKILFTTRLHSSTVTRFLTITGCPAS